MGQQGMGEESDKSHSGVSQVSKTRALHWRLRSRFWSGSRRYETRSRQCSVEPPAALAIKRRSARLKCRNRPPAEGHSNKN